MSFKTAASLPIVAGLGLSARPSLGKRILTLLSLPTGVADITPSGLPHCRAVPMQDRRGFFMDQDAASPSSGRVGGPNRSVMRAWIWSRVWR